MSHVRDLIRGANAADGVRYVRLPRPLHSALTTLDYHNRRVKLFGFTADEFMDSAPASELLDELDRSDAFTKLTLYARDAAADGTSPWSESGFRDEGVIRAFHEDDADARLWVRYFDDERAEDEDEERHDEVLAIARTKEGAPAGLPDGCRQRAATAEDADRIAALMRAVFDEYPSDFSSGHLAKQIATHRSVFRIVEHPTAGLLATASAELDIGRGTAEITDCVTAPAARGQGLSTTIVERLQADLRNRYGIRSVYSLARAAEVGINCVFSRLGYEHTGRLVNNCRMPTGWESMNVWCLPPEKAA